MKFKKYKFKTISDIAEVITLENHEVLLTDIVSAFQLYVIAKGKFPNLMMTEILWKDDNKNEITGIQFNDKDGKKIKRIKLKVNKK